MEESSKGGNSSRGVIQRGEEGIHRRGSSNGGGDISEEGLRTERSFFFPRTLYTPDSTSFFLLSIPSSSIAKRALEENYNHIQRVASTIKTG